MMKNIVAMILVCALVGCSTVHKQTQPSDPIIANERRAGNVVEDKPQPNVGVQYGDEKNTDKENTKKDGALTKVKDGIVDAAIWIIAIPILIVGHIVLCPITGARGNGIC